MNLRLIIIAIASIICFIGCEKDVTEHNNLQKGLTIQASTTTSTESASRTTFDGNVTKWVTGDEMTIMVGESNTTLTSAYTFTCQDGQAGTFSNNTIELKPECRYDFYAVYPTSAEVDAANLSAQITIGAATQTQDGDSPAHIAQLDPLTGCVKNIRPNSVSIPMHHNAAVMVINVVNNLPATLGIKGLDIIADDGITLCGTYDIDIASGELSNPTNASNTITVNVDNSDAISQDGIFKIYAAIAPCTLPENSTLKFVITDTDNIQYEFTKTFAAEFDIAAGDLLSTSFNLSAAETITYTADFTSVPAEFPTSATAQTETTYYTFNGRNIGFYNANGYKYDSTNKYIQFPGVGKRSDLSAKIYIPQIEGYYLLSLIISNEAPLVQNCLSFSLMDGDNIVKMKDALGGESRDSKYISDSTEAELVTPSNVEYIKVFSDNNTQGRNYRCKGLSLKYTKSE
ncbi:MAG: fimbrillin family protein [Alistipes sp.]|nr:fimbrillin family protein [Alistipes sp.]